DVRESAGAGPTVTQYNARHILVRPAEGPAGDSEARARIETLRARIAGGADFQAVAQESSGDTLSREDGGDLGWFTEDEFGPEFCGQVAALACGHGTAPFTTQDGRHIIQRVGSL